MSNISNSVTTLSQISDKYEKLLNKIGIYTIKDFLTYFPRNYTNNTNLVDIENLREYSEQNTTLILRGYVKDFSSVRIRGGRSIQTCILEDNTGKIKCLWFNQPFLKNVLKEGTEFLMAGKPKFKKKSVEFFPNLYEPIIEGREAVHLNRITPEYPLTYGLSRKWFRNRMKSLIDHINEYELEDELFASKLATEPLKGNIANIHFPKDTASFFESIKEVSLYELTNIQLKLIKQRKEKEKNKAPFVDDAKLIVAEVKKFIKTLTFELTADQKTSIDKLIELVSQNKPIDILLQGDVGSGKTIVAIAASLALYLGGYQTVILAPTTILAKQHYDTFNKFLHNYKIKVSLEISNIKQSDTADIIIGTTAVLARKTKLLNKLGLIIVDEQHKFGVKQREELINDYKNLFETGKEYRPHLINMSATPIPRSILQTFFGDLEVIRIKDKPKNRLPIITHIVPEEKRSASIRWLTETVRSGGQVYWVCPLVSESESLETKSAKQTYKELQELFSKEMKIGLLHGKIPDKEKLQTTDAFQNKEIDILVSTSVIEVGVDIPNANVIIIEDADHFGLAQLHQIRGRVGRGEKQSWCFLYASKNISDNGIKRLKYLCDHTDGLEIAEFDLKNRGPGEIYGVQQAGIPKLKIADLSNLDLIKESRIVAEKLFTNKIRKIQLFE